MILKLHRFQYSETETMGYIELPSRPLFTIERPWIKVDGHRGGLPYESCIPDGMYDLVPFDSERHTNTWAIVGHRYDVYLGQDEVPESGGRFACLFHAGNWASDVQGCIAPGLSRVIMSDQNAVSSSGTAMNLLRDYINSRPDKSHFLEISPVDGTGGKLPWQSR